MEELTNKFDLVIAKLKEDPQYQNLLNIKEAISQNDELMSLIDELKTIQKNLANNEHLKEDTTNLEKLYQEKLNFLLEIPLYQEYSYLLEDLQEELDLITLRLEQELNKISC